MYFVPIVAPAECHLPELQRRAGGAAKRPASKLQANPPVAERIVQAGLYRRLYPEGKAESAASCQCAQPDGWRLRLYTVIFEADTRAGRWFDIGLIVAILLSVLVVIADSVQSFDAAPRAKLFQWLGGASPAVYR